MSKVYLGDVDKYISTLMRSVMERREVRLIKQRKHGFEMYSVVWRAGKSNIWNSQDFWSENAARFFFSKINSRA